MTPFLSVVVPLHNHAETIAATLRSFAAQTLDPSVYEIIFIDDRCEDDTAERVARWAAGRSHVRMIANRHNLGRSRTRNRGWRAAVGEVIHFVDGDVIASPGLFQAIHARFSAGGVDVVSGRRWCLDLSNDDPHAPDHVPYEAYLARLAGRDDGAWTFTGDTARVRADFDALRAAARPGQLPFPLQAQIEHELPLVCERHPTSRTRALAFITSNVAVTRAALDRTTGFYPFLARSEDTELGLQLAQLGAQFSYAAEAEILNSYRRFDPRAPGLDEQFQTLVLRHPYTAVVAWYLFSTRSQARRELPAVFDSLVAIAAAEASSALAALDIEALVQQNGLLDLPVRLDVTRTGIAEFLAAVAGQPPEDIAQQLDRARTSGVLSVTRGRETYFDLGLCKTWLGDRTPLRARLHDRSFFRTALTRRQRGDRGAPALQLRWSGRYQVSVPREVLPITGDAMVLNLALPIETSNQRDIQLSEFHPPELAGYQRDGMILRFPLHGVAGGRDLTFGYQFSCTTREHLGPSELGAVPSGREAPPRPQDWLALSFPAPTRPRLQRLLDAIFRDEAGTARAMAPAPAVERAGAIYRWFLKEMHYRTAALPGASTLFTGFGHCITLSQLFINLCRLLRIPAREQAGALVDRDDGARTASVLEHFSPFAHTWAEFYAAEHARWIPVEMMPMAHGERMVTPDNFCDPEQRARFVAEGQLYDQYYFGHLDPFRIHGPDHASRLPTLAVQRDQRWIPVPDPQLRVRHGIQLTYEPVDPRDAEASP